MNFTKLTNKTNTSFIFDSQNDSSDFKFRVPRVNNPDMTKTDPDEDFISAHPQDFIVTVPAVRGNEANTVGGGVIKQFFGQYAWDSDITFSTYLTYAECLDIIDAKAQGDVWTLEDVDGNEYEVTFDFREGFVMESRVKARDRYFCKFKFRREA